MKVQYKRAQLIDLVMRYTPEGIPTATESWLDDTSERDEGRREVSYWPFTGEFAPDEKQMEIVSHARQFGDFFHRWRPIAELPDPEVDDALEREFRSLAQNWLQETGFLSDPFKKLMHPSHLKIIGMGREILPLILKEVERMSGHWFVALEAISPINPVKPEDEGNLERISKAWLDWGRSEGLI